MSTTRGQHLIGKEIGDCLLEKLIGYGGTSAVFLAQPRTSDQKVAVKVFLPRSTMDVQMQKNFYRRFLREAQAASELDHPHILSIYSYGEHEGLPYIVMPYIPGGTLSDYVKKHGPLSLRMAQSYISQIAEALDYAHKRGCVHCDVKPANILIDHDGQVVLSDFGIVRLMDSVSLTAQQSMKSPETLMGTPDYISPEQALGEPLDGRSDIYSLAVTLFFLLAGSPPFKAESSIAMALLHVHEAPPLLGLLRADVTPQIDEVIRKALAKWPDDRYQTAGAFSSAFADAVADADNIDQVVYTNRRAEKQARDNGDWDEEAMKPRVQIKLLLKRPLRLTRTAMLFLILSIALIGAITIAVVLDDVATAPAHVAPPSSPVPPLDDLAGDQGAWPTSSTFFFSQGRYHILNNSPNNVAIALYGYGSHVYKNFRLTVTMSEITSPQDGADYYGIVFRSAQDQAHYYLFEITASGGGQYDFLRKDGTKYSLPPQNGNGSAPKLKTAMGQSNTVTVEARGNTFTFFINDVKIGPPVTDTSASALMSGGVGLIVEEKNAEVAFSGLKISKLP